MASFHCPGLSHAPRLTTGVPSYSCLTGYFQHASLALAQVVQSHALTGPSVVYERFVWCENPEDKAQQRHAAEFYVHIRRWAKQMGIDTLIVEESSDVPHDLIKEKLGRIFSRTQQFARL